jgi:hypothetical protein
MTAENLAEWVIDSEPAHPDAIAMASEVTE